MLNRKSADILCKNTPTGSVGCDIWYDSDKPDEISLFLDGIATQLSREDIQSYPGDGDITAVLILVDVSDPKRRRTIDVVIKPFIQSLISNAQSHHKLGITTFSDELVTLAALGSGETELLEKASKLKAVGQSTEFFRSVRDSIENLKAYEANRKALIIISDGKVEDQAYTLEDVKSVLEGTKIRILSVGVLERSSDSPYLQNLRKVSDTANGKFVQIDRKNNQITGPFDFVDKGEKVYFQPTNFYGDTEITVRLGFEKSDYIDLTTNLELPDNRSGTDKLKHFVSANGGLVGAVTVMLLLSLFVGYRRLSNMKMQREALISNTYGALFALDGDGTEYTLNKDAIRIGRNKNNDIIFDNDTISSFHAEIRRRRDGSVHVIDLSSTNGTYVNEKR